MWLEHIAEVNADTKQHPELLRHALGSHGDLSLGRHRCAHCAARGIEDGKHGVAGRVGQPAAIRLDVRVERAAC
jgi:hypothetical protein